MEERLEQKVIEIGDHKLISNSTNDPALASNFKNKRLIQKGFFYLYMQKKGCETYCGAYEDVRAIQARIKNNLGKEYSVDIEVISDDPYDFGYALFKLLENKAETCDDISLEYAGGGGIFAYYPRIVDCWRIKIGGDIVKKLISCKDALDFYESIEKDLKMIVWDGK